MQSFFLEDNLKNIFVIIDSTEKYILSLVKIFSALLKLVLFSLEELTMIFGIRIIRILQEIPESVTSTSKRNLHSYMK